MRLHVIEDFEMFFPAMSETEIVRGMSHRRGLISEAGHMDQGKMRSQKGVTKAT